MPGTPRDTPPDGRSAFDIAAWDQAAERYAASVGTDDRVYTMLGAALWDSLGTDLRGLDVLDLGCAHGWLSALLAAAGGRVRGIDGSAALLQLARRTVPDAEFQQHDLVTGTLPGDRSYHRIVAHMVLMDLPDIDPVLAFVRRALRPEGRFVLTMSHPCFFNYRTREDEETGALYCGVTNASRVSNAVATLEGAERFESAAVGFAGRPSRYAIAWREVLVSRDAARHFRYLLDSAHTTAGRLYGLAGLRSTDAAAARDWLAAPPDWMAEDVDVLFGCIGGRQPIADLLPAILDGSWIRDWSSGEIPRPDM